MSMTLTQLRAEIRLCTNTTDTNDGGYDSSVLNSRINDAIQEIANITSASIGSTIDSGSFDTVASTRLYTFPTGALKIYKMYYDGDPIGFRKIDDLPTTTTNGFWASEYSRPDCWYLEGHTNGSPSIGFYPVPNEAKAVKTIFARKPAVIGADSDVPNLPEFLHPAVAWYVARSIWLDRQKGETAEMFGVRYMDRVNLFMRNGHEDGSREDLLDTDEGV